MDEITGALTQATPGNTEDGYFAGNGLATYNVRLILADTNGSVNSSQQAEGYNPLATHINFSITLKPTPLNSQITEGRICVVDNGNGTPDKIISSNFSAQINAAVNGAPPAFPDGHFGHHKWGIPNPYGPSGRIGSHHTGCIYYIGRSNPMASGMGSGAQNQILSMAKGLNTNFSDSSNIPVFYHKIGTSSHQSGVIHFTINTYSPPRSERVPNVFLVPNARFYYRQPTDSTQGGDDNPDWILLGRSSEMNQVGATTNTNFGRYNDAPALETTFTWGAGLNTVPLPPNEGVFRAISNSEDQKNVWVQTMRAFDFNELYDPTLAGASSAAGIEYAIVLTGQQQCSPNYIGADAQPTNQGICRSYVIADDLNFPTCAVWQDKNLYTANGSVPGKLFKYDTSTVGTDSAIAWRYINNDTYSTHTYRYARSPYGDYATEFYTGPTNNVLFIPAQENETRMNVKLDRGALTNIFQYNNLVDTDKYGNTIVGQTTIGQDLQFNVGLDSDKADGTTGTGRKIPSSYPNTGVASVRVFEEESSEYNHLQNYRTKGTLRVAKPKNPNP